MDNEIQSGKANEIAVGPKTISEKPTESDFLS